MTTTPAKTKPRTARKPVHVEKKPAGKDSVPAGTKPRGDGEKDTPPAKPLPTGSSTTLAVDIEEGADERTRIQRVADNARCPGVRAAVGLMPVTKSILGEVDLTATMDSLRKSMKAVSDGNMERGEGMLVAQADMLDALFYQLVQRSNANSTAGYLQASEVYMRLALKAQSQSRTNWEAISKIKHPVGATFIKQANLANGPQQVNNGVSENSTPASAPAPAREISFQKNELDGVCDVVDTRAPATPVGTDGGGDS